MATHSERRYWALTIKMSSAAFRLVSQKKKRSLSINDTLANMKRKLLLQDYPVFFFVCIQFIRSMVVQLNIVRLCPEV
jgi:hypothetical protein